MALGPGQKIGPMSETRGQPALVNCPLCIGAMGSRGNTNTGKVDILTSGITPTLITKGDSPVQMQRVGGMGNLFTKLDSSHPNGDRAKRGSLNRQGHTQGLGPCKQSRKGLARDRGTALGAQITSSRLDKAM